MLVLSRKPEQRIFIGDDIEVVVVEVTRHRVKLGFRVPKTVPVLREELVAPRNGEPRESEETRLNPPALDAPALA